MGETQKMEEIDKIIQGEKEPICAVYKAVTCLLGGEEEAVDVFAGLRTSFPEIIEAVCRK